MSRLLLLIAIVAVIYLVIRSYRRSDHRQDKPFVDDMVRCAQCGVHLPKGESIQTGGKYFCCIEHRNAYKK